ncbi:uncharacterized protein AKAW2_10722S [Aspergillus luchuensis]|uniref:Uncharacterized protein n=2 Tax=Aspergillus kawachii TaxID=1069201 RepID=A0A7R7WNW6_ASPKA|nr:uncharacterized protein AKAW2_10722S [Aspergillus luchuensis]OJZ89416.1 hypothetical protein ASPFODRAFT_204411 [Aspergillus luchuensis CBS 106.47]BCR93676.1 hypothetical protein AKAW2_10722S [Aspergillus luchuensis]BCS06304.1 hypothetical protein ALUC_10685S [Aspergillus luchuensis]GAA88987.1 similar to An02g08580 [Aspergillus luchuensis IFO 4308]
MDKITETERLDQASVRPELDTNTESERWAQTLLQSETSGTTELKQSAQTSLLAVTTDQGSLGQCGSNSGNDRSNDGLASTTAYTNEERITSSLTEGLLARALFNSSVEEESPSGSSASSDYGAMANTHRGIPPFFGELSDSDVSSYSDSDEYDSNSEPRGEWSGIYDESYDADEEDWSQSGEGDSEDWDDTEQEESEVNPNLNERFLRVVRSPPMRHRRPLPGQGKRGC